MSQPHSLVDLLRSSGTQLRIFDMGRRVGKLSPDELLKVELAQIPYPTPYLHHAWIALLMWNPKQKEQNVVWFLKLPLDEQGYLVAAARDDLLNRLLTNAHNLLLAGTADSQVQDALKDNPFSFKPDEEKMAIFHACASLAMGQPASRYYEFAQQYFAGRSGFDSWPALGYQGIADLVIRQQQADNATILAGSLSKLPNEPYEALCTALEHVVPDHRLFEALQARFETSLATEATSSNHIAAQVRAISNGRDQEAVKRLLHKVLATDYALEAEVIAAIATRCNLLLDDDELMLEFLERLAAGKAGQAGFSRILADLMFNPALRSRALSVFRNPQRSEALSAAIGAMFGSGLAGRH
ncbi:DUF3549 family protein [Marinobacterium arenosum]|uniref:DUF3549 family protein n=1 Tax=Marinobacterium arenosum TaxID=2862496 RepID=UPI001C980B20|nr:DUF3549 family protein [Marinobacterium arenosum]MBY4679085.1 DUF3549 family protein [Marinobacterium arenosum]